MISRERFEEAYNKHWTKLWLFARRIVKDDEMAKDIVHDAFIKSWNKDVDDIGGYLWRTTQTLSLDYLKSKIHRKFVDTSDRKYDLPDEIPFDNYQIEADYFTILAEKLPKECKKTIQLLKEGMTTKQAAKKLGVSAHCIRSQKTIAINKLRKLSFKYKLQCLS